MRIFRRQKPVSLVQNLVSQLEDAILSGTYKSGEKLPASSTLEAALGTSRGTLREALRILQQKGLVETRVGVKGGVFVREANADPVSEGLAQLMRLKKISLDDLAGFRQVIEPGLIELVASRIDRQGIERLNGHLAALRRETDRGAEGWHGFLDVEVRLRKELIRMSGSLLYDAVLTPIHDNIFSYAASFISGEDADVEEAFDDWAQVVDALARGDTERAMFFTRDHIRRYAARMKRGMAGTHPG